MGNYHLLIIKMIFCQIQFSDAGTEVVLSKTILPIFQFHDNIRLLLYYIYNQQLITIKDLVLNKSFNLSYFEY
jgi:hypothetical protein